MPGKKQKKKRASSGILAEPPEPGWFRICPNCGGWFALKPVSSKPGDEQGRIDCYQCRKCGKQTDFAERHPPAAV